MNLKQVIDELVKERGLEKHTLEAIVCESMESAYLKKYPTVTFDITYDHLSGHLAVQVKKKVVSTVQNAEEEISLKKARFIEKNVKIDDIVSVPFEGTIGRVEVLHARQIIAQRIRAIEILAVYNEFKEKENEIVHGSYHKAERGGIAVKLDDGTLAFLPTGSMSPLDKHMIGSPVRCLLKEVLAEPRNDHQIILDRASGEFVKKLMELEIPEIFEKLVEIKKVVRIVGYKSKVIVSSRDNNIDPVGTCIGIGGSRIKPILNEIGEKIDIIEGTDSIEELIKGALKPAKVERVELVDSENARVWVEDDQRSYAIGKAGQNIALASRLVGINIQLVQNDDHSKINADLSSINDAW